MKESVLNKIIVCPKCRTSFMPENGEICKCVEPTKTEWDEETKEDGE